MKFTTITLGCKVNLYETESLTSYLENKGWATIELPSVRIHTPNTHGTGCTLSSAFAAALAKGLSLDDAARAAKEYINGAITSGARYTIGHGHGPVDHFFRS